MSNTNDEANANDEIINEFLTECNEHLDSLDSGFVAIEQDVTDKKLLSSIFRSIHTIKGGAGMLAFNQLEKLTHAAESLLSLLRDGKLILNTEMTTALLQTVDAVRQMLDSIAKTSKDGDEPYLALIETLTQLQTKSVSATPLAPDVAVAPAPEPEKKAAEIPEIKAVAEPAIVTPVIDPMPKMQNSEQPAAEGALLTQESKTPLIAGPSIRISIELIDKLMNLVGELVLSRNQVLQCISTQSDPNFIAVSQRLNLITSELQEGVMKTRMQPIGNVWSKFTRIVRDLSVSCHKKVNLEMYGEETELDKTLIEAIKDPLVHIIRNSIDHGIETPEKRLAAGKPEEGTLTLKAYHEGGHVNIEIMDDGGGISAEKIKNKALANGVITADQAARMTEREALNLIFLPGLSTAEQVTNISGRGVGMDVVRNNIEGINGTIDLQSVLGSSTTLKIKIPLTLAIIPALIVTCYNKRYAIPQVNLLELVRLDGDQVNQHIQLLNETPIYKLRGKLLPLVYLTQELKYTDGPPLVQKNDSINIIVLQAGEMQFAVVVDHINDTQEIVVKPLSKLLKNLSTFSGATIMGDGKISLILEPVGLARNAGLLSFNAQANKVKQTNQTNTDQGEKQTLLLLRSGENNMMAVPLSQVDRIEEFAVTSIEQSGKQEVVQYRQSIMPLVRLTQFLNKKIDVVNDQNKVQVVVFSRGDRNFGLVVDHIYDIVEGSFTLHNEISRRGVLGTSIVEEKITEILDIQNIVHVVLPHYFDKVATA